MKPGRFLLLETGLFLVSALAVVFFGAVYPWASLSIAGALFALLFLYPNALGELSVCPTFLKIGVLSVFGLITYQAVISSLNRHATVNELLIWLSFACGFLMIQTLPSTAVTRWCYGLVFLGVMESLYGFFQLHSGQEKVLWQNKEFHQGFITGTYLNRNHLAGLLELCLGVHLGLLLRSLHKRKIVVSMILIVLLAIMSTAFFKTGSRAGMASFALAVVFFSFFLWKRSPRSAGILMFSAFLSFVAAFFACKGVVLSRFSELAKHMGSWEGRQVVWGDVWYMIHDHPWLGTGLGTFEWVFPKYQSDELWMGWAHAHQDYLELMGELGWPAFLVLMFSFVMLWFRGIKAFDSLKASRFALVWGMLISVSSLALHGFMDFNLAMPANAMLMVFLFATLLRSIRTAQSEGRRPHASC
ncbi:MAG: O-antigen ligase family protein [Candidatus Omnitrophica bacterium]|nr:O-antigen ligase family protein [Candidatus Omnitrophota bacterium]